MKNSGMGTESSKLTKLKSLSLCTLTRKLMVITFTGVVITSIKVLSIINI